jgi:hypothetical protein
VDRLFLDGAALATWLPPKNALRERRSNLDYNLLRYPALAN